MRGEEGARCFCWVDLMMTMHARTTRARAPHPPTESLFGRKAKRSSESILYINIAARPKKENTKKGEKMEKGRSIEGGETDDVEREGSREGGEEEFVL